MRFVFILIMLTSCAFLSKTQAQNDASTARQEKNAEKSIESKAFAAFNLNEDQKAKIKSILLAENKSLDSLRIAKPYGTDPVTVVTFQSKRLDILKLNDLKILVLLNDEQKKTYTAYAEKRIAKETIVTSGGEMRRVRIQDMPPGQRPASF